MLFPLGSIVCLGGDSFAASAQSIARFVSNVTRRDATREELRALRVADGVGRVPGRRPSAEHVGETLSHGRL
jgi:hypothetical protein